MSSDDSSSSSSGRDSPDRALSSKKRKADLEELEVNLKAPEPPSKRARRAQKKGKTLPAKTASDNDNADIDGDDDDAEKKDKDGKPARSEHGVWIGNLPFDVHPTELKKWIVDNSGGAVTDEAITRVHMPSGKQTGWQGKTNKGFAYVDFADVGTKVAAIALTETLLGHRKLLIKDASSFAGRPKKELVAEGAVNGARGPAAAAAPAPTSRKIFVGNLGFQTTEDDVRANFDKCGEIDWVKTATFEDSGKCKGYGWVMFREAESAATAVQGFVRLKEEIETEDDFVAKEEKDKDGAEKEEEEKEKEGEEQKKKFKTRKWWVNRIMGRNLKIELAEDDQSRYKKRFGKDAPKNNVQGGGGGGRRDNARPPRARRDEDGAVAEEAPERPAPSKELKAQDDLMVARLTGAAAKHTGTKITF